MKAMTIRCLTLVLALQGLFTVDAQPCTVCFDGSTPYSEDTPAMSASESTTCGELAIAAAEFVVATPECGAIQARGLGYCFCPPSTLGFACDMCPMHEGIINEDATLLGVALTCREAFFLTQLEVLDDQNCGFIQSLSAGCCGEGGTVPEIAGGGTGSNSTDGGTAEPCSLCIDKSEPFPDGQAAIVLDQETTCREIADFAAADLTNLTPQCVAEQARGFAYCGCPAGENPACDICPTNEGIINADVVVVEPFMGQNTTCRELFFLGQLSVFDGEECPLLQQLAGAVGCCGEGGIVPEPVKIKGKKKKKRNMNSGSMNMNNMGRRKPMKPRKPMNNRNKNMGSSSNTTRTR